MSRLYKKLIRTLLLLLVFSAVFPFVYPMTDGKPLLSLNQLKLPTFPEISLPEIPLPSHGGSNPGQTVTAYKWQDAEGSWQFGNEPPQGVAYETLELDPDANILPKVKASPALAPATVAEKQGASPTDHERATFGYSPEKIEEMMAKTRQAKDRMDAHHQALEDIDR